MLADYDGEYYSESNGLVFSLSCVLQYVNNVVCWIVNDLWFQGK